MEVEEEATKSEEVQVDAAGSEEKSDEALSNGSRTTLKRSRGRPPKNRSISESDLALSNGSSTTPKREQGRPKRSVTKKGGALSNSSTTTPKKGRPKRLASKLGASPITPKKGKAKGSVFTKPKMLKVIGKPSRGRPRKVVGPSKKCGRPSKVKSKRGRPKKILTPEEEEERKKLESQPRVLKPLGRPRIYPRNDPPVIEPRGRGRPRKTKDKRGAHLRKAPNPKPPIYDGPPHPPSAANEDKIEAEQDKANSEPPVKRSCNSNEKSQEGFPPVEESDQEDKTRKVIEDSETGLVN